jgi:hypothetical protein
MMLFNAKPKQNDAAMAKMIKGFFFIFLIFVVIVLPLGDVAD